MLNIKKIETPEVGIPRAWNQDLKPTNTDQRMFVGSDAMNDCINASSEQVGSTGHHPNQSTLEQNSAQVIAFSKGIHTSGYTYSLPSTCRKNRHPSVCRTARAPRRQRTILSPRVESIIKLSLPPEQAVKSRNNLQAKAMIVLMWVLKN